MGAGRAVGVRSAPQDLKFLGLFQGESNGLILLIIVIVLLVGALPTWGHSRSWGYFPSGGLGLVLLILLVLVLLGYLPRGF